MPQPMDLAFEERGSGPVLLFIHGFPLDRTMWIPQLAGLAKIRTCVAVDLRGHGLSADQEPGDYSMELFADDVIATLDVLKADQADICALSMGGYVAFSIWRQYPERVRSLILVDTKAEADSDEGKAGREAAADAIARDGMETFHDGLGPKLLSDDPPSDVAEQVRKMFANTPPEVAASDSLAMRDRADSSADLTSITVPVLWLHGEQDKIMPIEAARATSAKIPGATFVPIPNAGHIANMENPQAVNEAIKDFLTKK